MIRMLVLLEGAACSVYSWPIVYGNE